MRRARRDGTPEHGTHAAAQHTAAVSVLGVRLHPRAVGPQPDPELLLGLALRDNPRRAQLLVSRVLGKHVPGLSFVATLLSDAPALAPEYGYYQRLLARDLGEAAD